VSNAVVFTLADLCGQHLRPATTVGDAVGVGWVFTPALSAGEQTTFNTLVKIANLSVVGITPAEWQAIQPDIDGLVTYQGLASPTLAQTVLAVKAQSRILRALLRS
jgi:hypothetical protein